MKKGCKDTPTWSPEANWVSASPLLEPQCHHGVHFRGAARWYVAGREAHGGQQQSQCDKRQWVSGFDPSNPIVENLREC
jgi:hypothetical protein